jgi:hypothetical protein
MAVSSRAAAPTGPVLGNIGDAPSKILNLFYHLPYINLVKKFSATLASNINSCKKPAKLSEYFTDL